MKRRSFLSVVPLSMLLSGCLGSDSDQEDATDDQPSDLFAEIAGRDVSWAGECPPRDYETAEDIAATPAAAGYTVEDAAIGSGFHTVRGEQESAGASALYSTDDDVPLQVSIDIWDSADIAANVASDGIQQLGTQWRGESVTFEAGIFAHISDSPVTAQFRTLDNDDADALAEFFLTVPCFTPDHVVETSW